MEEKKIYYKVIEIVPVYNAQNSLERCLVSIIRQRYPQWELILVIRSMHVTKEDFQIIAVKKDVISRILTSYFNHNVIGSYTDSLKVESSPHNKFIITINLIPGFGLISKAKRQIQYEIDYNKSMEMRLIGDRVLRLCF